MAFCMLAHAQPSSPVQTQPAAAAPVALTYPVAARGTVVDDYHGIKVADPYRWLEDLDSPATHNWLAGESALTERYIGALPLRDQLRKRIGTLYNYERFSMPFHSGERYFYGHNTGLQNQSVLMMAQGLGGKAEVALDPNTLSTDGSLAVVDYVASEDGRLLAYGVSVSGSDWTDWHVRDIATGHDLPDVIRFTKYYRPSFAHDGQGLYTARSPRHPGARS